MSRILKKLHQTHKRKGSYSCSGHHYYVSGCSVNEAKKFLGKLAKKIRTAGSGTVEIIHTDNRGKVGAAIRQLQLYIKVKNCK